MCILHVVFLYKILNDVYFSSESQKLWENKNEFSFLFYQLINWKQWSVSSFREYNRFVLEENACTKREEERRRENICREIVINPLRSGVRFVQKGVIRLKNVIRLIPLWRDVHIARNLRRVIAYHYANTACYQLQCRERISSCRRSSRNQTYR